MIPFHELRFAISSDEMRGRLIALMDWLETERKQATQELARLGDIRPEKTPAGVPLRTAEGAKRDALATRIAQLEHDHETARCWMVECATNQTWQIGLELSRWLNRPTLAQSRPG